MSLQYARAKRSLVPKVGAKAGGSASAYAPGNAAQAQEDPNLGELTPVQRAVVQVIKSNSAGEDGVHVVAIAKGVQARLPTVDANEIR